MPPPEPMTDKLTTAGAAATTFKPLRTWIPLLLLPVMAFMRFVPGFVQDGPSMIWMASAFGPFLVGILVIAWWLFLSRARWFERLLGVVGLGLIVTLVQVLADASMRGPPLIVMTIPLAIAGFAVGLIWMGRQLSWHRTAVALLLAMLGGGISDFLRTDGVWGDFSLGLQWRWAPTTEDRLLASRRQPQGVDATPARRADLAAFEHPEWPRFRGPNSDGAQRGTVFSDDWGAQPPKELWRMPVGPAWSSFAVAGRYLVTQEQRGDDEAVVCYDGDTGSEVWQHTIPSRFFEALGGLGPRATPSIDGGAVYALGAEGWLVKLDASSGALLWKVDLRKAADREPPMWGFAASPCVHEGLVIIYAGGKDDKGVLAFKAEDGSLAWSAPCGEQSYGTVQTVNLSGRSMLGVLSEQGAHFYDAASGGELLAYRWPHQGYRALQPNVVDRDRLLIPTGMGTGTRLVRISEADGTLAGEEVWTSRDLKSDFNDCVVHEGFVYGFDNTIFTCIDLANGRRRWKGGRYEKGQALLLADSGLIVVVSERGELVLLRATPDRLEELAKIQALTGKTWNHPVVVGDKLYLRNAEEAVCYQLPRRTDAAAATAETAARAAGAPRR
jgi:outer membrane protein assembly factor BamB